MTSYPQTSGTGPLTNGLHDASLTCPKIAESEWRRMAA